jgi:hypothetical protein
MNLLEKISRIFSSQKDIDNRAYWVITKCNRCGEIIKSRIDLYNDLSIDYDDPGKSPVYFCRKTLMGKGHCFQRIEVKLTFDSNKKVINREISGGKFIDEQQAID